MTSMAVADEQRKGEVEKVKQLHKRNSTLDDGSAFVEMDPSERYGRVSRCACCCWFFILVARVMM